MPQSLPRPEDPTTLRRAAIATGEPRAILAAAGAWLRELSEEGHAEARDALAGLGARQLVEALSAVDVEAAADGVSAACADAFDAALEDDEEEREALVTRALAGLSQRDDVESVLVAAEEVAQALPPGEVGGVRETERALRGALSAIDAALRGRARPLTALNEARRARAEVLAPAHRAAAWWFTHLSGAEHDGLMEALAGIEAEVGEAAALEASRATLPSRGDAFGAALRALEHAGPDDPAARWARAEAARHGGAAAAVDLVRSLRVDDVADEPVG